MLIATQLPVKQWHTAIGDPNHADALCDRVLHRAPSGVVLSRCHLQRLPRFVHSGWPSGRGKRDSTRLIHLTMVGFIR